MIPPVRVTSSPAGTPTQTASPLYAEDTAIMEDITFYAHWELAPNAPVCHTLTLKDGVITSVTVPGKNGADPEDITEIVKKRMPTRTVPLMSPRVQR